MSAEAGIRLPMALLSSEDYSALNPEQRHGFPSRLHGCLELADSGVRATSEPDSALLDAIDDVELDALTLMSVFSDTRKSVSPYIVHSSWTFECDRPAMESLIGAEAAKFIGSSSSQLGASRSDVRSWLREWAGVLSAALRRFEVSHTLTEAIAQLVVIDALVAMFLVFAATVRLNARIS